jgi:hypothetical protein
VLSESWVRDKVNVGNLLGFPTSGGPAGRPKNPCNRSVFFVQTDYSFSCTQSINFLLVSELSYVGSTVRVHILYKA